MTVYRHTLVRAMIPLLLPLTGPARRGWTPLALALGAVLMALDPAPTLAQRFDAVRDLLDAAMPRRRPVPRTLAGLVKALAARGRGVLDALVPHLRDLTRQAAGPCWTIGEFVPMGVDGSKGDAPRTIANEPLGMAGRDGCGPQMAMLLLVHLGAMLCWGWRLGRAADPERTLLRDALDDLPERTLLVADAGFTGFDLLSELHRRGISFLVRVGSGVHLLRGLGPYQRQGKAIVHLWPEARRGHPPLTLRLIRVGSVWLITDVAEPTRLSHAMASELYRRRWGVELAFRALKQTLDRRKVRSGAAGNAMAELAWSIAGLWVLSLLGARAISARGVPPRRLSLAGALAAVRHAARDPMATTRSDHRLRRGLARAVVDQRRRHAPKDAYQWPHKKTQRPPGAPRLTTATEAQIRRARPFLYPPDASS